MAEEITREEIHEALDDLQQQADVLGCSYEMKLHFEGGKVTGWSGKLTEQSQGGDASGRDTDLDTQRPNC